MHEVMMQSNDFFIGLDSMSVIDTNFYAFLLLEVFAVN